MKKTVLALSVVFVLLLSGIASAKENDGKIDVKIGVFRPSWHLKAASKLNVGETWPAITLEYKLAPEDGEWAEAETSGPERSIGIEYTQKTGEQYVYDSNTYRDSGTIASISFISRWRSSPTFWGLGVGVHRTYFKIENLSTGSKDSELKTKLGLYVLGGFSLTRNFVLEARCNILGEIAITTTGGPVSGNGLYIYIGGSF